MFGQVINRVGKIADVGHKWGKSFGKWPTHPHPIFLGVPFRGKFPSRIYSSPALSRKVINTIKLNKHKNMNTLSLQ